MKSSRSAEVSALVPPPEVLAGLLPPDVDLATGWRHEAALPVWYGIVWGRLGRGDLAFAHLDRVRLPSLWPWIAAERGRILRELGLHGEAESLEFPALLDAHDAVDAAMLRVSLVADAVGHADLPRAERRLAAAEEAVAALADTPRAARQCLRLSWVQVEVACLADRPVAYATLLMLPTWDETAGQPHLPDAYRHGSAFHRAKGLLFAGIVRDDVRLLDAAAALAPPVLAWSIHLARADRGLPAADDAAREAWSHIVPPPEHAAAVAATATGQRLSPEAAG